MTGITEAIVQDWLDRYVEAWRTYDTDAIADLFTAEAEYRFHPGEEPVVGREEIVESWQNDPDPPGSWTAEYETWIVSGSQAVAVGRTRYHDGPEFWNVFLLEFDDGRCRSFTDYYVAREDLD
jgi:ketosteroid isomerase-like protein